MLTSGTWDFLQANQTGNFYDAQARALFHGAWNVPADIVNQEGIRVGRRTYMYFGPVPAVLRMPILFFTSRFDGRLTEPSMLLAELVALIFASRLSWKVRNLISASPVSLSEAILTGASIMVLGVGSELLFLASAPSVYHEAEIWAVAFALGAFDAITGFLIRPSTKSIALAGVFSGLCLLTRATIGVGPIAALFVLAVGHLVVSMRHRRTTFTAAPAAQGGDRVLSPPGHGADDPNWLGITERGNTRWVALGAAGLIPVCVYTWINEAKFHSFFSVPLEDQVEAHLLPAYMNVLVANGGKQFGLKFLPTDLLQYLRPDALRFSRVFPFITFPPPATVIGHLLYFSRGPASSVTAMMPAIAAAAIVGIFFVFRSRRDAMTDLVVLRVPLIGAALGAAGVLVYLSIVQRAVGDLMPLLVLAGIVGFQVLVHRMITMARWTRRILLLGAGALALFGILATTSLSILFQREMWTGQPSSSRDQFVALQERINKALFGEPLSYERETHLPTRAGPAGSLVILGNCAALYLSDGKEWAPVERSGADGNWQLAVTFPAIRGPAQTHWPLVVTGTAGAGDYVAVQPVGADRVKFAYLFQDPSGPWLSGPAVTVTPGHRYLINVSVEPSIGYISVSVNGTTVLSYLSGTRDPEHVTVGSSDLGGPVASKFPGRVKTIALATPTCDSLLRSR